MQWLVKSFPASDDAGHHYTIEVYQDYVAAPGHTSTAPGPQSFETSNGCPLNRIKRGEYQLRDSGRL